ncbi:hypothetical protein AALA69_05570 [Eggerthellaceae bacterium 24-137]
MTDTDPQQGTPSAPASTSGTSADANRAAREAAAAFIQSADATPATKTAEEAYGTVGEAQAQNVKHGHGLAIVIGLLICALACAGIAAFLFTNGTFSHRIDTEQGDVQRVPLSDARVLAAFDEVTMEAPDISKYAYVPQDALIGPKFSDIIVNEPMDLGAPSNQIVECTATATATFKNKGIEITVPVTLPFEYSVEGETWVPGDLTQGDPTATPLASANASDILADLDEHLMAHDATYGEAIAEATIVKTTSELTIDGGPITVSLSKTLEEEEDGKTINELRTCDVVLAVAWSPESGWVVSVADAGEIDYQRDEIPDAATAEAEAQAAVEAAANNPIKLGTVKYGDTITLGDKKANSAPSIGTIQKVEKAADLAKGNKYSNKNATDNADGNVQLVLKLRQPVELKLNGTNFRLTTLAVAVSGLDDNGKSLIGRQIKYISGPMEEAFGTSWCPFGIKTLEIGLND